jgi:hypothetical protein
MKAGFHTFSASMSRLLQTTAILTLGKESQDYMDRRLEPCTKELVKYIGESNENRKSEIKIRNIAPLSYKLADMLPML